MAPEAWRGEGGPHSDQYSLAITYVEMRPGIGPFQASTLEETMQAHLEAEPDLEPLPLAEQKVLRKALAKAPADRYENCRALVRALAEATRLPVVAEAPPRTHHRPWVIAAACVLGLVPAWARIAWAPAPPSDA